jgi:hypothetical protein
MTIKAKEQHSKQKGKSIIDNPEIQATLGTRRNEDKQNKNTIQKTELAINDKQSRDTDNDCLLLIATSVFCIVFLFCLSSFRLVPNVACISGFSIIDFPFCLLCCSFALIVDTSNIGHKTERRQTKQKHNTEN